MTDDQLRGMVREAIARHMGAVAPRMAAPGTTAPPRQAAFSAPLVPAAAVPMPAVYVAANAPGGIAIAAGPGASVQVHISHATFALPPCDGSHSGTCEIDPHGACDQCGFCQSFGH